MITCLVRLETLGALACLSELPPFHISSHRQIVGSKFVNVALSAEPYTFPKLAVP
jgi:hypothetical protein